MFIYHFDIVRLPSSAYRESERRVQIKQWTERWLSDITYRLYFFRCCIVVIETKKHAMKNIKLPLIDKATFRFTFEKVLIKNVV